MFLKSNIEKGIFRKTQFERNLVHGLFVRVLVRVETALCAFCFFSKCNFENAMFQNQKLKHIPFSCLLFKPLISGKSINSEQND
jgi:hypothetical protein